MKKRLTMLLCAMLVACTAALAQTKVSGVLTQAEDGEPIVGARVVAEAAGVGTVTDVNGCFTLAVPAGTQLHISYVGNEDIRIKAKENMKLSMHSNRVLDDVMVVAYGTAKKSAFTGSAAVLDSKELAKTANSNVIDALRGKVTGVQTYSATGQPGQESFTIRVRGIGSLNAGNAPLIIVDNAPFSGDLNTLANTDIESMTVLKDAASAALYGARGANGVILITTKSAKRGRSTLTVDAKWGSNSRAIPDYNFISDPAKYYEVWYGALNNYAVNQLSMSASEAHRWANNNLTTSGTESGLGYNVFSVPEGEYMIGLNGKMNPNAKLGNVVTGKDGKTKYMLLPDNWQEALYQKGLRQEYTLTATGANNEGSFYLSANYLGNQGITKNSDFKRFTTRLKADYQIKPWLKLMGNISYAHYESKTLGGPTNGNALSARTTIAPIYPIYIRDEKGNHIQNAIGGPRTYDYGDGRIVPFVRPVYGDANPLQALELNTKGNNGNAVNATGTAEVRFLKNFKFTSVNTVMLDETRSNTVHQGYFGQSARTNGSVSVGHGRTLKVNYQQLLSWHRLFGSHDIDVMVGHEYYKNNTYSLSGGKNNIFSIDNGELDGAIVDGGIGSGRTVYNIEGWLGRAQYNFDNKYFASASFRRDGSSTFHPKHRWGNFWSLGGAWLLSKEKWFQAKWVDELKVKASYGEQGNDAIGNYLYTERYSLENSNGQIGLTPSSIKGNEFVSWEKSGNFNAGIEFSLWRGRLTGGMDGFVRKTTDMLTTYSLPPSYGYRQYYDNVGDMVNRGVELELQGIVYRNRDFQASLNANLTWYKNKIVRLPDSKRDLEVDGVKGYSSGSYFYGEGISMYTHYMPRYAGVDPKTGKALYWKTNKDTGKEETTDVASDATKHLCGTELPKAYGGFGTNISYKGFDFSMDFTYQLGGLIYDGDYSSAMSPSRGRPLHVDLLKATTLTTYNPEIPRMQYKDEYTTSTSDRFLISASYLSLQNINLGYTLPRKVVEKMRVENLRLYVTANNLWVWSKRQGLDPRQGIGGSSNSSYSPIRTISAGVTVSL